MYVGFHDFVPADQLNWRVTQGPAILAARRREYKLAVLDAAKPRRARGVWGEFLQKL